VQFRDGKGGPITTAVSGQDVVIEINYDTPEGKPLKNVVVQVKFAGSLDQPLFACKSEAALSEPLVLPPRGRLICRIPRLPLIAGMYTYTIWGTVGGVVEDHVRDAGKLAVADGDFFGTGRLPGPGTGPFLLRQSWEVHEVAEMRE
jgi:lipopolysaccharide transport system ATP-binding protein